MEKSKACCDNSTCPNRKRISRSSSQSSSVEDINKLTVANKQTQSSIASARAKTTENTSEANFDGNNQDLKSQTNTSQISHSESQTCALMIKYPCLSNITYAQNCCLKCLALLQSSLNATTTSSLSMTPREKCNCKADDGPFSSSSSSSLSQRFPLKNKQQKSMPKKKHSPASKTIVLTCVTTTPPSNQFSKPMPNVPNVPNMPNMPNMSNVPNNETYFSCSSDESDNEDEIDFIKLQNMYKNSNIDKNGLILLLLQEVVNLINKEFPVGTETLKLTQGVSSSAAGKCSGVPASESEMFAKRQEKMNVPPPQPWCHCACYAQGLAAAQAQPPSVMPSVQPYNLKMNRAHEPPIPNRGEESQDVFFECSRSTSSLSCKCPDYSIICPTHGPFKEFLKNAEMICYETNKPCDIDLPMNSELLICKCTLQEKDKYVCPRDGKTIEFTDGELEPEILDASSKQHKEPLDNLPAHNDPEPGKAGKTQKFADEEFEPERFPEPSVLYNEPVDNLSMYDDEEPDRPGTVTRVPSADGKTTQSIEPQKLPLPAYEEPVDLSMHDDKEPDRPDTVPRVISAQSHGIEGGELIESLGIHAQQADDLPIYNANINKNIVSNAMRNQIEDLIEEDITPRYEPSTLTDTLDTYQPTTDSVPEQQDEHLKEKDGTDRNVDNDQRQVIRYKESEEEEFESYYPECECEFEYIDDEYELAKEKRAESRKKKKYDQEETSSKEMALATIKQMAEESSPEEMKFFIDSLILDLEAMEAARRKPQYEKKICRQKTFCGRDSFPVTITEVTELGANSLYIKWIIHDCCGIGGYEIYTDGYLTNRFYNSKHEAAVITNVDVTTTHQITLVAQPSATEDKLELLCNICNTMSNSKSLPWDANMENDRKALFNSWTPSVYLYTPCSLSVGV